MSDDLASDGKDFEDLMGGGETGCARPERLMAIPVFKAGLVDTLLIPSCPEEALAPTTAEARVPVPTL